MRSTRTSVRFVALGMFALWQAGCAETSVDGSGTGGAGGTSVGGGRAGFGGIDWVGERGAVVPRGWGGGAGTGVVRDPGCSGGWDRRDRGEWSGRRRWRGSGAAAKV